MAGAGFRSHRPTQTEEAFCRGDVAAYLFAQGFGVWPTDFVAQAAQECQSERRLLVESDGVEVEQVGFDGEGVGSEGGTVSDIGDGVECFAVGVFADRHRGDVDAVCG